MKEIESSKQKNKVLIVLIFDGIEKQVTLENSDVVQSNLLRFLSENHLVDWEIMKEGSY